MEATINGNAHQRGGTSGEGGGARLALDTNAAPAEPSQPGSTLTSPINSPPYWVSHQRSVSNISVESIPPGAITLQDNTDSPQDAKNGVCWAKNVLIEDYVVVNGHKTGIGAFVVFNVKVETFRGSTFQIRKRYSEFVEFRDNLCQTFPNSTAALPELPPKSIISKFRPKFLENRRSGLQYFLNCILLNPQFAMCPVLKEFLFE